ncbi:MAG: hypothetical protein R2757_00360 [Draconibacterium sp.]
MRKIGFLLIAILMGTTISMAQPGGQRMAPEERAKQQTAELKEALGLDKTQEKKVYDLNLETGKKMQKMREEMGGQGFSDEMREKMQAMREETNKEMKKILTDEQYKKYEKYLEERRARRGQGGPNR